MEYTIYKLQFPNGVHFGEKSLDETRRSFSADTLYSALYLEALRQGKDTAERLLELSLDGKLLLSDAFPWIGDTCYLPKPMKPVEKIQERGNSVIRKAIKGLSYIPMGKLETYFQGELDAVAEQDRLKNLGKTAIRTSAYVYTRVDTEPFHVGVFTFSENCGLYVIAGTEGDEPHQFFYDLLDAVSFTGIGGKRSAGLGRFVIAQESRMEIPAPYDGCSWMALSISLPKDEEMDDAMRGAKYRLIRRSGFVYSETYADEPQKKKDLYMMESGSCFLHPFSGGIYDVSSGGRHPVYRYGKPLFWPV